MGFGRAGWYSYDWLDNLGRRSATRIHPEWQDVGAGDPIPAGPIDFVAAVVERPTAFVLRTPNSGRVLNRIPGGIRDLVDTLGLDLPEYSGLPHRRIPSLYTHGV